MFPSPMNAALARSDSRRDQECAASGLPFAGSSIDSHVGPARMEMGMEQELLVPGCSEVGGDPRRRLWHKESLTERWSPKLGQMC